MFRCVICGYTLHADLNAARNLAAKGACSSGVGAVTEPLNGEVLSMGMHHGNRNLLSAWLRHFDVRSRLVYGAEDVTHVHSPVCGRRYQMHPAILACQRRLVAFCGP